MLKRLTKTRLRFRFGIRSLIILMTVCAIVAWWLRPLELKATIEPTGVVSKHSVQFRMTNQSRNPLWYEGNGNDLVPYWGYTRLKNGKWEWAGDGGYGPGMQRVELKPHESVVFDVWINEPGVELKAGVRVTNGKRSTRVWSTPGRFQYNPRIVKATVEPTGATRNKFVQFKLTNTASNPLWFRGYGTPLYSTKSNQWGKWVAPPPSGVCGTGLYYIALKPGESVVFDAEPRLPGDEFKVGVWLSPHLYGGGGKKLWSSSVPIP